MEYVGFAEKIKNKRKEIGKSTLDIAKAVGCSRRSVMYWEKNERNISLEHAEKVLAALGYHIEIVKDERV